MPIPDRIQLMPPIAIARLGSSESVMGNYEVEVDGSAGYRALIPAATLRVEPDGADDYSVTGRFMPTQVRFKDGGDPPRIRPVAPFVEVWGHFEGGEFRPITKDDLEGAAVSWRVSVANHKAYRRTLDPNDQYGDDQTTDHHRMVPLVGRGTNILDGGIPLGRFVWLKPTDDFPELRMRFYPPPGQIYGHSLEQGDYISSPDQVRYRARREEGGAGGVFHEYDWQTTDRPITSPVDTYAPGGVLDDTSDGVIEVTIGNLTAKGRLVTAPPDFAPDSRHLASLVDELTQMLLGPEPPQADNPAGYTELATISIDTMRRAVETLRLMNLRELNDIRGLGRFSERRIARAIAKHAEVLEDLERLLSDRLEERQIGVDAAARIVPFLRLFKPTGPRDDQGAPNMPAMMAGPTFERLQVTRRQQRAFSRIADATPQPSAPVPLNQTAHLVTRQVAGNPPPSTVDVSISNCFPGLEFDFRAIWTHLIAGLDLHEVTNEVVGPQDSPHLGHRLASLSYEANGRRVEVVTGSPFGTANRGAVNRGAYWLDLLRESAKSTGPLRLDATFAVHPNSIDAPVSPVEVPEDVRQPDNAIGRGDYAYFTATPNPQPLPITLTFHPSLEASGFWVEGRFEGIPTLALGDETFEGRVEPDGAVAFDLGHTHPVTSLVLHMPLELDGPVSSKGFRLRDVAALTPPSQWTTMPMFERMKDTEIGVPTEAAAPPGHLTRGLCSPWQHDFRDCACYYWAAARPDFINQDASGNGEDWMTHQPRAEGRRIEHEDIYTGWEQLLTFVIGGRDTE